MIISQYDPCNDEELFQRDDALAIKPAETVESSPYICVVTSESLNHLSEPINDFQPESILAVSAAQDRDAALDEMESLQGLGVKTGIIYLNGQGALGFEGDTIFEHSGFNVGPASAIDRFRDFVAALADGALWGLSMPQMIEHGLGYVAMLDLGHPAIDLGFTEVNEFLQTARLRHVPRTNEPMEVRIDRPHRLQHVSESVLQVLGRQSSKRLVKAESKT